MHRLIALDCSTCRLKTEEPIVGDVEFVQTSCGYAAPEMKLVSQRKTLTRWAEVKGDEDLVEYRRTHNRVSVDALETPVTDASE